jgi:hypothetical protein
MLNELHVPERHTARPASKSRRRPGETRYRHFLGVKWSQVQILSARHRSDTIFRVRSAPKRSPLIRQPAARSTPGAIEFTPEGGRNQSCPQP